ncbi:hypothetical protein JL720_472 [Aureococcus anophagefferens]|nr:hypothetical protein JL720_472 [Aureococcus anophagefferens]
MTDQLNDAARPLIDLIDTLRAHGVQRDLCGRPASAEPAARARATTPVRRPLPQIAVMGDQSAGKSSVLEMISGVPFPRGSGLRLTEALCAVTTNGFSTETIVINLSAPDVPDLTLLDLPGIVRTAVAGQNADVVGDVNGLITSYLEQERTIVLAVMPANQDIATIDILERAAVADPGGMRTLAVLTKPDLVDDGAEDEVKECLMNRRKPLRLGFAMVKCRTQRELDGRISLSKALVVEREFFEAHPYWSAAVHADERKKLMGVQALTGRLSSLLVERIKVALPEIKYELQQQRLVAVAEFERLGGDSALDGRNAMRAELVKVVAEYATLLRQSARGNYGNLTLARQPELRLFGEGQEIFKSLKLAVQGTQPQFDNRAFTERLAAEMHAFRGRELPGFTNSQVFYGFMVQNIEEWRPYVEECRQAYVAAAAKVSDALLYALAPTYPMLVSELRQRASDITDARGDDVRQKLDVVFAKESDPYTTNESMLELINQIRLKNFDVALQSVLNSVPPGSLLSSDKNVTELAKAHVKRQLGKWYMQTHGVNTTSKVEDMCTLLEAYWDVATNRLVDNVCMTLEHDFTNAILKQLEEACFMFAAEMSLDDKETELARLFLEDPQLLEQRAAARDKRDRMTKALASLSESGFNVVAAKPQTEEEQAPSAIAAGFVTKDQEAANDKLLKRGAAADAAAAAARGAAPPRRRRPTRRPRPRRPRPRPRGLRGRGASGARGRARAVAAAPAASDFARNNPGLFSGGLFGDDDAAPAAASSTADLSSKFGDLFGESSGPPKGLFD